MHLETLIERLPGVSAIPARGMVQATEIRGVTSDPDRAGPDTIFAAIPSRMAMDPLGTRTAVSRGAPAVICQPGTVIPRGTQRIVAEQPGRALSDVASALNGNPISRLHVFRVGLGGRVSGAAAGFLHALLEHAGHRSALLTAEGGLIAGRHFPNRPSEADSHEWQRLLAAHLRSGGTALVVEDHPAVDEVLGSVVPRSTTRVGDTCGRRLRPVAVHWRGSRVKIDVGTTERLAHTPIAGSGCLRALDAAISACASAGADPAVLASLVPGLPPTTGFMEPVQAGQPFGVFVDGANDAASIREVVREAQEMTQGAVILVTGGDSAMTSLDRQRLGEAASEADRLVLTADNPRRSGFAAITADILRGTTRPAQTDPDRQRAILSAIRQARAGDIVILAGKARRPVQEIDGTIVPWDDRTHARDALAVRGWIGDLA